jgi:hypothetical protein
MIKKGTVCIWQNLRGDFAKLNGHDVTAMSGLVFITARKAPWSFQTVTMLGYHTDQTILEFGPDMLAAEAHQLREKNPPKEEETTTKEKEIENV